MRPGVLIKFYTGTEAQSVIFTYTDSYQNGTPFMFLEQNYTPFLYLKDKPRQ